MKKMVLLLLMFSCSSQKRMDGFGDIENKDFREPKQVYLDYSNDVYSEIVDETDVLAWESLARLSSSKLKRFDGEGEPLSRALAYCYKGKFGRGFKLFDKHYRRYKKNPGYWNKMGTCYFLKGNRRKALLYYNKSRSVSKKYAPPINNLGVIYEREEGKVQKALLAYQKASELGKFSLTPIYNIGQIYLKYGLGNKAEPLFAALYRKNPDDVWVASGLATSHLLMGNVQKSVRIFDIIDKSHWKKAVVGLNYAVALKMSGESERAKKVFKRVRRIHPREKEYYEEVKRYVQN